MVSPEADRSSVEVELPKPTPESADIVDVVEAAAAAAVDDTGLFTERLMAE